MTGIALEDLSPEDLEARWLKGLAGRYAGPSGIEPTIVCLAALLRALEWRGGARQILESLPADGDLGPEAVRNALSKLGFRTHPIKMRWKDLSARLCPCLHISPAGQVRTVLGRADGGGPIVTDGREPGRPQVIEHFPTGEFLAIERLPAPRADTAASGPAWLQERLRSLRPLFLQTVAISLAINVLVLAVPLAIMAIYDQVVTKGTDGILVYVVSGVAIAFVFDVMFRLLRARAQAFAGARLDYVLGAKVFERILHLPASYVERAPVGGQITRIREFETFREFFTGGLSTVVLDLPFVVLFLAVIAWLAGPLVLIPVVLGLAYLGLAMAMSGTFDKRIREAGAARSERYAFLSEMTRWLRPIKQAGGEDVWEKRIVDLSADASWMSLRVNRAQALAQNLSQTLLMTGGVATLAFGVARVINEQMTLGALIATMILVWRVLQPMQTLFGLSNRLNQVRQSLGQLKRLLSIDVEQHPGEMPSQALVFEGRVEFNRVSMRHGPTSNPALLGVTFDIRPGELVALAGPSGSGKSTVAGLAIGLMTPQAGTVKLDGIDIRQLKPITLRQKLAYVPQRNHAFPGTIFENIALADPTADIDRVRRACEDAGVLSKIEALPNGFETRFREGAYAKIPQDFLQQLALARALLRDAPVIVMDEPASALDEQDDRAFMAALARLKGSRTILMVTQRPSHMRACDKLIVLRDGQVSLAGPPTDVLKKMAADAAATQQRARPGRPDSDLPPGLPGAVAPAE